MTRIIFTLWDQHIRLVISYFFQRVCKKNSSVFFPLTVQRLQIPSRFYFIFLNALSLLESFFCRQLFFLSLPLFGIIIIIINDFKLQTKNTPNHKYKRLVCTGVSNNTNKRWRRSMLIWGPRCQFIPPKSHAKVSW